MILSCFPCSESDCLCVHCTQRRRDRGWAKAKALLLRAVTLARSASDPGRGAGRCGVCVRLPAGCVRLAGVPVGRSEASHGRGGGARRLLQVCSQFDQQTAAAAAANAGLVVVGDGAVRAVAAAAESGLECVFACFVLCREGVSPSPMHLPFGIVWHTPNHPATAPRQSVLGLVPP